VGGASLVSRPLNEWGEEPLPYKGGGRVKI
jgi:hypothetical protein